jgi:hypothetical protein
MGLQSSLRDPDAFDPSKHGLVPFKRDPVSLLLRLVMNLAALLASDHPADAMIWLNSMVRRRKPLSLALPWITFDAVRFLKPRLTSQARIFEYGSGHSTLFWAESGVKEIYSVEDSEKWSRIVGDKLRSCSVVHLIYKNDKQGYIHSIDMVPGEFDIILVDGSYRRECAEAAIGRLREGGLLVVDNTDWHWYSDFDRHVPSHWPRRDFPGFVPFLGYRSQTTAWIAKGR